MSKEIPVTELAKALYTVNRHAKTALEPQHLYYIKKETINKLLREQRAEKIGLHFSNNPKRSNQYSTLLVKVGDYYFHIPPSKEDFKVLSHLGNLDHTFRNPQIKMPLSTAKKIIHQYIDWKPEVKKKKKQRTYSAYYTPSSLGEFNRTSRNNKGRKTELDQHGRSHRI